MHALHEPSPTTQEVPQDIERNETKKKTLLKDCFAYVPCDTFLVEDFADQWGVMGTETAHGNSFGIVTLAL
jgi:hypothetical protein